VANNNLNRTVTNIPTLPILPRHLANKLSKDHPGPHHETAHVSYSPHTPRLYTPIQYMIKIDWIHAIDDDRPGFQRANFWSKKGRLLRPFFIIIMKYVTR